jgi:hypothetical protein
MNIGLVGIGVSALPVPLGSVIFDPKGEYVVIY